MFRLESEYSWLTSHDVNYFFYMKRGTRVLYMSDMYDLDRITPLHVFAWFCRANGSIKEDLVVPEPDFTYYKEVVLPNETGLILQ